MENFHSYICIYICSSFSCRGDDGYADVQMDESMNRQMVKWKDELMYGQTDGCIQGRENVCSIDANSSLF